VPARGFPLASNDLLVFESPYLYLFPPLPPAIKKRLQSLIFRTGIPYFSIDFWRLLSFYPQTAGMKGSVT